ncbi:dihydroorotate dehydrogenase electron transfer subunit [Methanocaldococcus villosus KIN24-T80]|uniref:Probable dihydroorotate dehydrogenase B (NAD(+)), electron transfer subunit n=1 Tax=Methanocaldococcus villosus KIN24-T80 TaxID=1069083 RepID=N6V062_9EURY|nr:dihydroorotate dehydrogenase electron transfer subunit [Methanocaldococcus villosus]ENN95693.1 dihydroorotate dehydrogenase electron transfer subunit [Methanocaldococcus villosus KIN24-T80]
MYEVCKIINIIDETPTVKTFVLDKSFKFKPGQFAMIWLPEVNEKPFSFASENSFTIAKVGPFTDKMHKLKIGDKIAVRGPYGSYFKQYGEKILAVAGGVGAVPIVTAVEAFNAEITTILGARNKDELLFIDRFKKHSKLLICTDDGSLGFKGYTTDLMEKVLKEESFDSIIACGPEVMLKKVVKIAYEHNIPVQVSMERYMKCGIGVCGHCCLDNGLCVCKDGPVFTGEQLRKIIIYK